MAKFDPSIRELEEENEVLRAKVHVFESMMGAAEVEMKKLRAEVDVKSRSPLQIIAIVHVLALSFWILTSL